MQTYQAFRPDAVALVVLIGVASHCADSRVEVITEMTYRVVEVDLNAAYRPKPGQDACTRISTDRTLSRELCLRRCQATRQL